MSSLVNPLMGLPPATREAIAYYGSGYRPDSDEILAAGLQADDFAQMEFVQNLILEAGFNLGSAELGYLQERKQAAMAMQGYGLLILMECVEDGAPHFQKIWKNAYETINFHMGNHWSREDEAVTISRGLKPYSWPNFRKLVNPVLSEIVAQLSDYRVIARNERSEVRSELANKGLKWVAQTNKLANVKFDLSRDALLAGVSVVATRQHPLAPTMRIQNQRCRPMEFMWDMNSPTDSTLADVKWVLRENWVDRTRLAAEFPEWREDIMSRAGLMTATTGYEESTSMLRPLAKTPASSAEVTQAYDPTNRQMYGRLLFRRELYLRRWVPRLMVVDPFEGKEYPCRTADQALLQQRALEKHYMETPVWSALTPMMQERVFQPQPCQVEFIDQFIFIGNHLVRVNHDSEGGLPYIFCVPEFYDGDVTSYFDHAKGPQRWHDRAMQMLDDLKAGAKGGMIINTRHTKHLGMSDVELGNKFNETNWKLYLNEVEVDADGETFDPKKIITYVTQEQNEQVATAVIGYLNTLNQEAFGGPNMSGTPAFAGQTGKSTMLLRAAGSNLTLPAFMKMGLSDTMLGQRDLYLLGFLHPATQMRVYGDDLKPEYFSMLSQGVESLADYDFDVDVIEVQASPSEKQARLQRLEVMLQTAPQIFKAVLPYLLKNSDIEYQERQAIIADVDAMDKAAQDATAVQQKFARDEMEAKMEISKGKLDNETRAQTLAEQNLPKYSFTGKAPVGPMADADFINWARMNIPGMGTAHPSIIMADRTAWALYEQARLNYQQTEEDRLTPQYKKDAIMHNVAVKEDHETAKDAANRATREVRSGNAAG